MNKTYWLIVLSSAAFAAAAQQPDGGQDGPATPPQSQQMQMQMQEMESRMQAIQNTEDPEGRQRLLDEHAKSMHQGMTMMGEMMQMMMGQMMQREAQPPAGEAPQTQDHAEHH